MKYLLILMLSGCSTNQAFNPLLLWDDNIQYDWGISEQRVDAYNKELSK